VSEEHPLGILGGTNLFNSRVVRDFTECTIENPYGNVECYRSQDGTVLLIPRHGIRSRQPPHRIDHHANISALHSSGVKFVVGITSVGSLKLDIEPGTFIIPDDFIQLSGIATFHDMDVKHITPTLCLELRERLFEIGTQYGFPVRWDGTYIQTSGPRFETKAEIRFFSTFADVVGMNMATEATLALERSMDYANISVVDNYANGIRGEVSFQGFMAQVEQHQEELDRFLRVLIPELQKTYK